MDQLNVRIARREQLATDVVGLELVAPEGGALPPFTAGAHIDVHLGEGLVRQYSLCNDPAERGHYRIAVLRDPASRGGSQAVHERLQAGQDLRIGVPRNAFALVEAPRALLFAGGIGITPMLAFAQELQRRGAPFELHYCARSADRQAFRAELGQAPYADRVRLYADDAGTRLDAGAVLAAQERPCAVYVCGPSGFIAHVLDTARAAGWPDELLRREYFGAAPAEVQAGEQAFEVELAGSGQRFAVPPGRTIVQVLGEHGIEVPVSCEQGVCGTCLTRVVAGTPEHRDSFLTDEEHAANDQMTPCCSRACTALLVLEL